MYGYFIDTQLCERRWADRLFTRPAQSLVGRLGSFLVRLAKMCAWLLMRFQERFTGLPRGTVICIKKKKKASGFPYFLNEWPRAKSYGNPLELATLFLKAYTCIHTCPVNKLSLFKQKRLPLLANHVNSLNN